MDFINDLIKEHDGIILYVVFGLQCLIAFLGFPWLISQCLSEQKRLNLSYGKWMLKWTMVCFVGKWMIETYDLVEVQMKIDGDENHKAFDPYKLLHIDDDGSFDTKAIDNAYNRLAAKYHPSKVNPEKVPREKAYKRWNNLNLAYDTLKNQELFDQWKAYGDPHGAKTVKALNLAVPRWILEEEFRPTLITWGFISLIAAVLALSVMSQNAKSSKTQTKSGIEKDSKANMKEFLMAVLEDDDKSQRTAGLSDSDIIEIFQQSVEIIALEDQLQKKATFNDIVKFMMKRAKEMEGQPGGGDSCCGNDGPPTPDSIIGQFMPKLADVLIEILAEEPFQGKSTLVLPSGTSVKYRSEMLLKTILNFVLRVLGGKLLERRKIAVESPKQVSFGDAFDVSVKAEKLPFVKEAGHAGKRGAWIALVNLADNSMQVKPISPQDTAVEAKFKIMPQEKGKVGLRAYVVSSDGQIQQSPRDNEVAIE